MGAYGRGKAARLEPGEALEVLRVESVDAVAEDSVMGHVESGRRSRRG